MSEKQGKWNRKTKIIGYKNNIPIILCKERVDFKGGMKFYCQYCRRNHYHGRGEGHRAEHCDNEESPFKKTGYIITLGTESD